MGTMDPRTPDEEVPPERSIQVTSCSRFALPTTAIYGNPGCVIGIPGAHRLPEVPGTRSLGGDHSTSTLRRSRSRQAGSLGGPTEGRHTRRNCQLG